MEALIPEVQGLIKSAILFSLPSGLIIFFTARWFSSIFGWFEEVIGR